VKSLFWIPTVVWTSAERNLSLNYILSCLLCWHSRLCFIPTPCYMVFHEQLVVI